MTLTVNLNPLAEAELSKRALLEQTSPSLIAQQLLQDVLTKETDQPTAKKIDSSNSELIADLMQLIDEFESLDIPPNNSVANPIEAAVVEKFRRQGLSV